MDDKPKPRLRLVDRQRPVNRPGTIEQLAPADHVVRVIWDFAMRVDLSALYSAIKSVEGHVGAPATDPRLLFALWLFATINGVGSARRLDALTTEHDAYRWLCGGVSVNYHSLSDFRVDHGEFLDDLLTHSVACLMQVGAVDLARVTQDGVRVRASAGAASFRRRDSLERCLQEAKEQVERLKQEVHEDPAAPSRRVKAARERAARERQQRVEAALSKLETLDKKKTKEIEKSSRRKEQTIAQSSKEQSKPKEPRASTTDVDANVMKMADGGYRPAYNGQFVTDTQTAIVVGVEAVSAGNDMGLMEEMLQQIDDRYGQQPEEYLADGGYVVLDDIEHAEKAGVRVYAPVPMPHDKTRDRYLPLKSDSKEIGAWRHRMGTLEAKEIYKERASVAEWLNAQFRNHGLLRLTVRGLAKVRSILLWHALANNLLTAHRLGLTWPQVIA